MEKWSETCNHCDDGSLRHPRQTTYYGAGYGAELLARCRRRPAERRATSTIGAAQLTGDWLGLCSGMVICADRRPSRVPWVSDAHERIAKAAQGAPR